MYLYVTTGTDGELVRFDYTDIWLRQFVENILRDSLSFLVVVYILLPQCLFARNLEHTFT
jgi:hypothetical protein